MNEKNILPHLPRLNWVQTIPDPIWREIPITEVERKIIQTTAFYRLRGIKQLGFAYLAYPGARHTRFEHSLGVMHTTDMLLKMMRKSEENPIEVSSTDRQILRLAALLHDIGHPPFSHAMENLFTYYPDLVELFQQDLPKPLKDFTVERKIDKKQLYKHEFFTEYIICTDDDIKRILSDWLEDVLGEIYAPKELEFQVNSMIEKIIAKLAVGKEVSLDIVPRKLATLIPLFRSIMSGDIDADKIDYLMRDNHYCGLPYSHDPDALRDQLMVDKKGNLKIDRGALLFVQSLLLARYRLITEVHHEQWDVFATSRAIELLHKLLIHEKKVGLRLVEIVTQWNDSKLLDYLLGNQNANFQQILTTAYPLTELAQLDFLETHPSIRACIEILSNPAGNHHIPELQKELRDLTGNKSLIVHVRKVKLPEFSMKLIDGGELLGDAILRGISEESVAGLKLVVYGRGQLNVDWDALLQSKKEFLPCAACTKEQRQECIGNLEMNQKRLLAELVVQRYREIVRECAHDKVTVIDFLMFVMKKVDEICRERNLKNPIRQHLYTIARNFYESVSPRIQLYGSLDLSADEITSSFHQQLRKYEQLGLIGYSREIRRLKSEDKFERQVFRFDRRFHLSPYGDMWFDKITKCFGRVEAYDVYKQSWDELLATLDSQREDIAALLQNEVDE